jgi:hypothetical protein
VNRCPERTTLYCARLIFGFEHLPPIRGGPLRARKRFNYLDFVFCLICMSFVYLFLYHACIYSLLDYIESLCGIATPLVLFFTNYIKYTILAFHFNLFARFLNLEYWERIACEELSKPAAPAFLAGH